MSRYVGKFTKKPRIPMISWVLILIAVLTLLVGGVVAYLSTYTGAVTNAFAAEDPTDPTVIEGPFNGTNKTDVKVNVGKPGYAVYVRAAVVVTWKDAAGNVLGEAPVAGVDYSIDLNLTDWLFRDSDGFYYHKKPVAYNGTDDTSALTSTLINSCKPIDGRTPDGYGLNVEIIAQTIQALGTTDLGEVPAVQDAWGVTVENGEIQ